MGQESLIEKAVSAYARDLGFYVRKFKSPSQRGVPDKLFLSPGGRVQFVEFKAPGKKPTALQLREIREINERGGHATWIDSMTGGKKLIDEILKDEI